MQAIAPVTTAQLLASGQEPKAKFEIYVDPYWVNICDGFSFLLSACDATTDWVTELGSLSIDTADKKEGIGSLKDNVASPVATTWYETYYNPTGSWDWSAKKHLLFWLKCDRASTVFTVARLFIMDTSGNWRAWFLTFSAGEWTAVKLLLSTGDWESGTPPNLALIDKVYVGFQAADTTAFYKKIDDLRIDDVAAGLTGKNYLEDWSISLGGASMTPNPIGGTWSATLFNEDGIFHPKHPTSAYIDWFKTGRKARLSIGGKYGGTDYYWQRIIGYMDEPKFSTPDYRISISGADYMKFLQDAEFGNLDNYWGTFATFSSISSDGESGIELYNEADAMDITGEADNVANWVPDECTFVSFADVGGGSTKVGKAITTDLEPYVCTIVNDNIFVPVAGKEYVFNFKYKKVAGAGGLMRVLVRQFDGAVIRDLGQKEGLHNADWAEEGEEDCIYFTAQGVQPIQIWLEFYQGPIGTEFWVDQFSIHAFTPYYDRHYELPVGATGPYRVLLDGVDVWYGESDEGYGYEEATRRVAFDINKTVATGVNNLVIHYFTAETPENVLADILVRASLYVNRAAALAAMGGPNTGISIDKNWFEVGSPCLDAVRMICERCDWRFHLKWDGTPVFAVKPAAGGAVFTLTDPKHIASAITYQDRNEIRNRIVIEGHKQAEPVGKDDTLQPELRGEAHDVVFTAYGERTMTIKNHLFQSQASIDAMCTSLLAEYKDPKWYADLPMEYLPVPLELGDNIQWEERLSPVLDITQTGIIRDIKISNFKTTYKCEIT